MPELVGTRRSKHHIGFFPCNCILIRHPDRQAGDIVAELRAGIAMKALVIRNGKEQEIEARDIVPGDIVSLLFFSLRTSPKWHMQVILEEGNTIPADAKVLL
jgi:H+-transporting ATPase